MVNLWFYQLHTRSNDCPCGFNPRYPSHFHNAASLNGLLLKAIGLSDPDACNGERHCFSCSAWIHRSLRAQYQVKRLLYESSWHLYMFHCRARIGHNCWLPGYSPATIQGYLREDRPQKVLPKLLFEPITFDLVPVDMYSMPLTEARSKIYTARYIRRIKGS